MIEYVLRNTKTQLGIYVVALVLGFASFLPIAGLSDVLNDFVFRYKLVLVIISFLAVLFLSVVILVKNPHARWKMMWFVAIYLALSMLRPVLKDINNNIVIRVNENRQVEEFTNPILGMKMEIIDNNKVYFYHSQPIDVYEALVFSKNHGLDESVYEIRHEASVKKIYNADWWWFVNY